MALRGKILSLFLVTFVLFGVLVYGAQRLFILPSFTTLENEESLKDMGRAVQAIAREVELLGSSVVDYASWDDTYRYSQDRNELYREANLTEATIVGLKINIMYFFDEHHTLLWGMVYDLENEREIAIEGLEQQLADIRLNDEMATVGGVLLTAQGPALLSVGPILTSNSEGPAKGYVVLGRFLSSEKISVQAGITLQVTPLTPGTTSPDIDGLVEKIAQQEKPYIRQEERTNRVYSVMPDIGNKAALLLEVAFPRSITARGQQAVSFALISLLVAGVLILIMLIVVIQKMVLNPLQELTEHTVEIGKSNDLSVRLSENRKDEIGILSKEFNRMIEQLKTARKTLMVQSYDSGKAEVASSILHSVGNALNGVVLSSYQLMEKAKHSSVGDVSKVAGLLKEQEDGLARFFTEDSRGRMVPQYLGSLATVLEEERQNMLNEVMALQERVNHIKDIISRQQNFSKPAPVREIEQPGELLEDALKLSIAQRANTAIEIQRDYQSVPNIRVDRHKVLQILLNLINNARNACMASGRQDKTIVLRLICTQSDRVLMQVVDNGIGIPADALSRIFEQAYASQKSGQGFGLHTSSLAASELGGKLTVESEGPGLGATSTLELPCSPRENR